MDAATRASLEILRARNGFEAGSLLGSVKSTVSAAGARMLAAWLAAPVTDLLVLEARQTAWLALRDTPQTAGKLRVALRGAPDLARALGRIALNRAGPRDLAVVRDALVKMALVDVIETVGKIVIQPVHVLDLVGGSSLRRGGVCPVFVAAKNENLVVGPGRSSCQGKYER